MIVFAALDLGAFSAAGLYTLHTQGWTNVSACSILIWIETIINLILFVLDLHLLGFHIYLQCKGMTTYELILKKHK